MNQSAESIEERLKRNVLYTSNYDGLPGFPGCVEGLNTLDELLRWLGTTDFTGASTSGAPTAISDIIWTANLFLHLGSIADWILTQVDPTSEWSDGRQSQLMTVRPLLEKQREVAAFEAVLITAFSIGRDTPGFRAALAQWVCDQWHTCGSCKQVRAEVDHYEPFCNECLEHAPEPDDNLRSNTFDSWAAKQPMINEDL